MFSGGVQRERERPVAQNEWICFRNIFESLQIGLRKKFKASLKFIGMV